jgi:4-hydroxy-tetrahydrodipicolinate reductase
MSLVNAVMSEAVERIARFLDEEYDIAVLNQVHRRKRDIPSGTALALGQAAARGRGVNIGEVAVRTLDGNVPARTRGSIGFSSTRGGEAAGVFSVFFYGTTTRWKSPTARTIANSTRLLRWAPRFGPSASRRGFIA